MVFVIKKSYRALIKIAVFVFKLQYFHIFLVFYSCIFVINYQVLKSKVIEILKTFSAEEIKEFRSYLHSPFHNSNKKVIKLYDLIRKFHPEFNSKNIQKEYLFSRLYPSKKYSDIVMRILISDMLKLLEEFLAYIRYSNDPITEKKYLLKELEQRKLVTLFNRHIRESEQLLEKEGSINNFYFLNRFDIESAKFDYFISTDRQDKSGDVLGKQGEYLANFFLMNGLNILQEMNEYNEVLNYQYDSNLLEKLFRNLNVDDFFSELKKAGYKYYPLLEIYYCLYRFSQNYSSNDLFDMLKNSVFRNLEKFDENERKNVLLALESCAVSRIRLGIKNGQEDLMDVYEHMLSGLYFSGKEKKYMQANLFRNIFYTAVMLKKLDWAERFAGDYADFLLPEQKPDMINYTRAMLCFEKKEYLNALEFISKVNYTFFVFKYEAKILSLKIHYELESFEPALSLIDSFSHFLSKNKIVSVSNKEPFMNFLKFLKLLIRRKSQPENGTELAVSELLNQAESMEHFISKRWIVEKIKQLND